MWDTEGSGTQAPLAHDTHCDAAFVVDELAEVFIQVLLVLVDICQQHRQLLLKRHHLYRTDLCGSLLDWRQCLSAPRGVHGPQKQCSPKLSLKLSGALHILLIFTLLI